MKKILFSLIVLAFAGNISAQTNANVKKPSLALKVSAFDFTIYGGLEGELIHISPDAIVEKNGNTTETFYLIKVKTNKNYLGSINKPLKIIPGMESEVDILTGKKTILSFLLKPVLRAKYSSLRER